MEDEDVNQLLEAFEKLSTVHEQLVDIALQNPRLTNLKEVATLLYETILPIQKIVNRELELEGRPAEEWPGFLKDE